MFNLKLKQAENAFADGRLDEAYNLLSDSEIASHRQAQKLIAKLAGVLVERGSDHLTAGRIDSALSDCSKAEKLAGNLTAVSALRSAICSVIDQNRFTNSRQQALINDARDHIQKGMHSVGRRLLEKADSFPEAKFLLNDVSLIAARTKAITAKAQDALDRNDIEAACEIIAAANINPYNAGTSAETIRKIKSLLCEHITVNLNSGRIDLAEKYIHRLNAICPESVEAVNFGSAIRLCKNAWHSLQSQNIRAALECLGRLRVLLPDAVWIGKAAENASNASQAIDKLMVGPLSMVYSAASDEITEIEIPAKPPASHSVARYSFNYNLNTKPPSKFIMQIDGIGSYLVICDDSFTIGPVSSPHSPDVGLIAQPDLPVAAVDRTEGDYFIRSDKPISVNDTQLNKKLLADGDKISLSMRCRMRFNIPNVASSTGVISLASARYTNADIRSVIIMDREIIIGPSAKCHIPAAQLEESLMIIKSNGRIHCRAEKSGEKEIEFRKPVSIGGVTIVFKNL